MKTKYFILFLCYSILSSCQESIDKIEFKQNNYYEIKTSMEIVRNVIHKSKFDTIQVKKYLLDCEIETSKLYPQKQILKIDSISSEIEKNFSTYLPLKKFIFISKNGEILLNERIIAKNFNEFRFNIKNYKELEDLSLSEKEKFIKSLFILTSNNIISCRENYDEMNFKEYYFEYSKDKLYYGEKQSRYLYLKRDIIKNSSLNHNYVLLDQMGEIYLYKKNN